MPRPAAAVKWTRSHGCRQLQPNRMQRPPAASACYARPPRRGHRQRGEKSNAKPASESQDPTAHIANASSHSSESEQRKSKPRGQSALAGAQQQAPTRQPRKQRSPSTRQGAKRFRLQRRIGIERCSASGWHKHTEQTRLRGRSSHNASGNASTSHAESATSSATHPVGRERDLTSCQDALANGAANASSHRFFRANSPQGPRCEQTTEQRRRLPTSRREDRKANQSALSKKIRRGITYGVSAAAQTTPETGVSLPEKRQTYNGCEATAAAGKDLAAQQGRPLQTLVMPGRHEFNSRQRGP